MSDEAPRAEGRPQRALGLHQLLFVSIGGIVGSGWLFGSLFAAKVAGPASIVSWLIGGFMVLIAALPFAEVGAMLPVVGGLGRLPQFSHGNVVGMFVGWIAWFGYVTTPAIEVQALLEYASNEAAFRWLFDEGHGTGRNPLSIGGLAVAFVLLGVFALVNALGVKFFARVNTPLTWFKLLVPVVAAVALLTRFDSSNLTSHGFAPYGLAGVLSAVATGGVVFSYIGFRHAIDLAGEARRPQVTVPAALTLSLLICIALFITIQVAFVGAIPASDLEHGWAKLALPGANGPVTALLSALGLTAIANVVLADAVAGPLGAGLVASASTGRLVVAVSRDGLFPRLLNAFSHRGVPLRAFLLNMVVGCAALVVFRDGWQQIFTFNTGAIVLSFVAGPVTMVALRRQLPDRRRPFRLPMADVVGASAFVVVGLIVYWSGWQTIQRLLVPMAIGALMFLWKLWRDRHDTKPLDLRQAIWLLPWFGGLCVLSWLGSFGGGREVLSAVWGTVAAAALALSLFPLAVHLRLPSDRTLAYVTEDHLDEDEMAEELEEIMPG